MPGDEPRPTPRAARGADDARGDLDAHAGPAAAGAEAVVRAFLAALQARDLGAARAHLAPGAVMTFPGGARLGSLEDLLAWAVPRYRRVAKDIERVETAGGAVWCFGTLRGEWPDGAPFEGVRFADRFEVAGGLIRRQDVWNDLAEARLAREGA